MHQRILFQLFFIAAANYKHCDAVDSTAKVDEGVASATISTDEETCINEATCESDMDMDMEMAYQYPAHENERSKLEDEEDDEPDYTFEFDIENDERFRNMHPECEEWASEGICNSDPPFMLKECIPACLSHPAVQEFGLLEWGLFPSSSFDDDCVDRHTIRMERGSIHAEEEDGDGEGGQNCEDWAEDGLCMAANDKPFMLEQCKKSCMVCIGTDEEDEETFDMGIGQIIPQELIQQTIDTMIKTSNYMQAVMNTENEKYHSSRRACKNLDEFCAIWGGEGKCDPEDENHEWMVMNCAPVCQTCELLDTQIRCPIPDDAVDAFPPNGGELGLNAMFERIAGVRDLTQKQIDGGMDADDLRQRVEVFSRPGGDENKENEDVIDGPWVITIDNFLTDEECDFMIEAGKQLGYERSVETTTLRDGSWEENQISEARTSTNAWCDDETITLNLDNSTESCKDSQTIRNVKEKMELFTSVPPTNSEHLQLLNYDPGQFYKVHHDYIEAHAPLPSGPRILTMFLYLNDVEEGGGTRFPELAPNAKPLTVDPKKGKALLWPSVLDDDPKEMDEWTMHEALPVVKGKKYAANAWLHLRDEQNVDGLQCG